MRDQSVHIASIRYAPQSKHLARFLAKRLHEFRSPKRLVRTPGKYGPIPRKILASVEEFEDGTFHVSNTGLEFLVLIISSNAQAQALSAHRSFLEKYGGSAQERVIPVLVDGELPAEFGELAVDIRTREGLEGAPLAIAAAVVGVPLERLVGAQADAARRRFQNSLAFAMLTLVFAAVGVVASLSQMQELLCRSDAIRAWCAENRLGNVPTAVERREFDAARGAPNGSALRAFVARHPESPLAPLALTILQTCRDAQVEQPDGSTSVQEVCG